MSKFAFFKTGSWGILTAVAFSTSAEAAVDEQQSVALEEATTDIVASARPMPKRISKEALSSYRMDSGESLESFLEDLYLVVNHNSNKCLAVRNGSPSDGAGIMQWTCGGHQHHYWYFDTWEVNGRPIFRLINNYSGRCLAVPGGSQQEGTELIQWTCGTWFDHFWWVEDMGGGRFRLKNYNSDQCAAIPDGSKREGERVIQWGCGTWRDHYWSRRF